MSLEERFIEFVYLSLEEKEKQGPTLAREFFKIPEEFRYAIRGLIKKTNSHEILYKIVSYCGMLAVYAGQNVHWVINYMKIRKAELKQPKASDKDEGIFNNIMEIQFEWPKNTRELYSPNPPRAYAEA